MRGRKLKNSMVFTLKSDEVLSAPFYVNDGGKILSWRDYKIGDAIKAYVLAQLRERHPDLYKKAGTISIRTKGEGYVVTVRNKQDVTHQREKLQQDQGTD